MARGGRRSGGRRSQPTTPRTARTNNPTTPSSGRGSDGLFANGQWFCDCKPRRPAALRETRKPGANKGRWFYTCPQERRSQCTFFLWEDYAGVSGGSHSGPDGPRSATQPPRPTYRTSIGQRTTPPAERMDGPAHMTLAGQRSLPPPPPSSAGRQRIFTTPTAARELPDDMAYGGYENQGGEEDEDEDDGFEPPPTPTPARTRRQNAGLGAATATTAAAALPAVVEPPPATETPSHPITKYFGVVKNGSAGDKREGRSGSDGTAANGLASAPTIRAAAKGRAENDYSDSDFDSDMERALVALADHSERKTRRHSDKEKEDGLRIKKEEEEDSTSMVVDDVVTERRRGVIVPLREEEQHEPETPSRPRTGRRLLVASDEYAAKEAAAAEAADKTPTRAAADPGSVSSFASLFRLPDSYQAEPIISFESSLPSSQPASQAASSQALTQESAVTTPPSSFRSDAGRRSGASTGSGKRQRPVDPWYGTSTQGAASDNGGDDSDDNDPFTATPSKRVRFRDDNDETMAAPLFVRGWNLGEVTYPVPTANSPTPTHKGKAVQRPHCADDEGMHVDGEGGQGSQETGTSSQPLSQPLSQPNDHNVTLAVLQLLAGQPVEPRVRQQIRALLNGAFLDEASG